MEIEKISKYLYNKYLLLFAQTQDASSQSLIIDTDDKSIQSNCILFHNNNNENYLIKKRNIGIQFPMKQFEQNNEIIDLMKNYDDFFLKNDMFKDDINHSSEFASHRKVINGTLSKLSGNKNFFVTGNSITRRNENNSKKTNSNHSVDAASISKKINQSNFVFYDIPLKQSILNNNSKTTKKNKIQINWIKLVIKIKVNFLQEEINESNILLKSYNNLSFWKIISLNLIYISAKLKDCIRNFRDSSTFPSHQYFPKIKELEGNYIQDLNQKNEKIRLFGFNASK